MDPYRAMDQVYIIRGRDSFGSWRMATSEEHTATCPICGEEAHAILRYWQVHLPMDIPVDKTMLKRPRNPIGVDCGCWSRWTRQVVHISESGLRKGFPI